MPDIINGNAANNTLDDTAGATDVFGFGGDDFIRVLGPGQTLDEAEELDRYDGGAGVDQVYYADLLISGVVVDLGAGTAFRVRPDGTLWAPDELISIERVFGTHQDDTLTGSNGNDGLASTSGDDVLAGLGGQDSLFGGAGDDTIDGGSGHDLLDGWSGEDTIDAGSGDDTVDGGNGDDTLDGGTGIDTVVFSTTADRFVDLTFEYAEGGGDGYDVVRNFENVITGSGDDTVFGDALDNVVDLGEGDDRAFGLDGNDTIQGRDGNDTLRGDDGDDVLNGGGDDDRLLGNAGEDTLNGGTGNDELEGGGGDDFLNGAIGSDTLEGGGGDDLLFGGAGNAADLLIGGTGVDTMNGGGGPDIFRWETSTATAEVDEVRGFVIGVDRLSFADAFLADAPNTLAELQAQFVAFPAVGGDSVLLANTANGWQAIAKFDDVDWTDLADAIDDGSLFTGVFAASLPGDGGLIG